MVDETTLEIEGKVFEIGDEIDLTDDEKEMLKDIQALDKHRSELQQWLISAVHLAEKNVLPELREPAHEINGVSLNLSYYLNRLLYDIQTRIGGKIPMDFKDQYSKIVVRAKRQGEPLNYTVQSVKQSLNFAQFEAARDIAVKLVGDDKTRVKFDLALNTEYGFQPVAIDIAKGAVTLEAITEALSEILKEKPGIPSLIFLIDSAKSDGDKGRVFATPLDDRQPARIPKIIEFGKKMEVEAVCVISRGGVKKDMLPVSVAFQKGDTRKTTVLEVALSSKEVSIIEEKEGEFDVPNGETYAGLIKNE
jgi:hypothetical protein